MRGKRRRVRDWAGLSVIVQLSDVHLLSEPQETSEAIVRALVEALDAERTHRGKLVDLLVLTGDVFDSATLDANRACRTFVELHERLLAACGQAVPTIIVPGNHDRRRSGLFAPHSDGLFSSLKTVMGDRAFVHGGNTPFLSAVVPASYHGQPYWVVAYDSTYLPRGWVSAGGVLRQEDLLHAAAVIGARNPDWPVVFLLHHHLVPTPLTDVGEIDLDNQGPIIRWTVKSVLPAVVANADREELTMTALGAGTAISTLHSLGRAVLVLHGHKHYSTARLLDGMKRDHGDVLLVSAGSCGTAQPWNPTHARDVARLWPSFNWIELTDDRVVVDTVAFGWKGTSRARPVVRPLVDAARDGAQWMRRALRAVPEESDEPELERNESLCVLSESETAGHSRWDFQCTRTVQPAAGTRLQKYSETVDGLPGGRVILEGEDTGRDIPVQIRLEFGGQTRFVVLGGLARTLNETRKTPSLQNAPYGSVGLMNRYWSREARLEVDGLGEGASEAFGSVTDLGTGLERPMSVRREGARVALAYRECPPRSLLRIYWPLRRD